MKKQKAAKEREKKQESGCEKEQECVQPFLRTDAACTGADEKSRKAQEDVENCGKAVERAIVSVEKQQEKLQKELERLETMRIYEKNTLPASISAESMRWAEDRLRPCCGRSSCSSVRCTNSIFERFQEVVGEETGTFI